MIGRLRQDMLRTLHNSIRTRGKRYNGAMPQHWSHSLWLLLLAALALCGCRPVANAVVVYVSLDEPYARPVIEAFTRETGVAVRPLYDTEANKSRGLAQRILSERERPRADVFWSSEVMQTLVLRSGGALASYRSPSAAGIPARYRDPEGYWTGFAARFRVLVYHNRKDSPTFVAEPPRSLLDLTAPCWKDRVAMANPLFGTTTTEAAALFQVLGAEQAQEYYRKRKANGTRVVDGNSVAADLAARGEVSLGQTDTDDAYSRIDQGLSLDIVFPDQQGKGALLIPNTAALVKDGPHPELGKRFLDFLLRAETEEILAKLPSRQLPLHTELRNKLPEPVRPLAKVRAMEVDYNRLRDDAEKVDRFLREVYLP
jgi:iron(III) transport system substrate-binding protein